MHVLDSETNTIGNKSGILKFEGSSAALRGRNEEVFRSRHVTFKASKLLALKTGICRRNSKYWFKLLALQAEMLISAIK